MAATFVLFMTGPAQEALGGDLERHGFEYCHSPHPTAVLRPDGTALVLEMDRAANIAAFNARSPADGDQHAMDVGAIEQDAEFLFTLLGQSLWSRKMAMILAKRAWKVGLGPLKEWFGEALEPARGWLETRYSSPDVQALWAPWVLHVGLTPEASYGGQMARVIAFALEAAGAPVVKGGAGQAAQAFSALIKANGGQIRTGVEARKILVKGGKAVGVTTADGEELFARNVIASTAPDQLYDGLLADEGTPAPRKKFRHGRGNFQMHFALDGPVEWAAEGLEDVALIHLSDGIDAVSKSSNEAERGMLPVLPTVCVGQPHRLDPSRCPEGKALLWLQIPDAPVVIKGDAANEVAHLETWLADSLAPLDQDYALSVELLKNRRLVKGYSDTHARGLTKFTKVMATVKLLQGREDAAEWMNRIREAALKDPDGTALDGAIETVRSFADTDHIGAAT